MGRQLQSVAMGRAAVPLIALVASAGTDAARLFKGALDQWHWSVHPEAHWPAEEEDIHRICNKICNGGSCMQEMLPIVHFHDFRNWTT